MLQQQLLQQGNTVINTPSPDPELITINTLTGPAVANPVTLNLEGYHAWAATNLTPVATRVRLLNARSSSDGSSPPAGQDMSALSGGLPTEPPANTEVWADAPPATSELGESPPLPPAFYPHANHDLSSSSGSSGDANRTLITANTSTGSTKVDELVFELGDTDMEQELESDAEIYDLALEDNEMAVDDHA
jgi:hypothetical protein